MSNPHNTVLGPFSTLQNLFIPIGALTLFHEACLEFLLHSGHEPDAVIMFALIARHLITTLTRRFCLRNQWCPEAACQNLGKKTKIIIREIQQTRVKNSYPWRGEFDLSISVVHHKMGHLSYKICLWELLQRFGTKNVLQFWLCYITLKLLSGVYWTPTRL